MAGVIFNEASGVNTSIYGECQAPIQMFIESYDQDLEKNSQIPNLFKMGTSENFGDYFTEMTPMDGSLNHDHKDTYSPLKHDHASEYAAKNHDHGEKYAPANHNHGTAYAPLDHSHTFCIEERVTLFADSWKDDNTMAVVIATIPSTAKVIIVSPDAGNENYAAYMDCGVRCVSQGSDGLTFRCEDVPDIDLVVNLVGFV